MGLVLAVALGLVTGCVRSKTGRELQTYPLTVADTLGVTLAAPPQRIVSLAPSHTEILFGLGLGARVGVTAFCNYPPEALGKPSVGAYWGPSLEVIVALAPDIILADVHAHGALVPELSSLGLRMFVTDAGTVEEVFTVILDVGRITGAARQAEELVAGLRSRCDTLQATALARRGTGAPRVFRVIDAGLWTAGPGSFMHDLTRLARGENVAGDAAAPYVQFSMEALLERDPDVMLLAVPGDEYPVLASIPGWTSLRAVREGRVFFLDPDTVSRPGPRIVDALDQVVRALYPQAGP